ncbi:hypothetical protein [Chitinophaga tropicalis]|uniref:Uncharacterized protein n=1 Tax=Chitinophaga tropicalis TaxID=2683588 RepID=A0A7K1U7Y8_9BACT|nr:hypothetical protein [Chitinophaga tropicalis]MVT10484.1 hypothetical protein [Chitinophaga tropicalis]
MCVASLVSCSTSIKLSIPEKFKEQATMQHVSGARGNRMSFANFNTSRIKRGIHLSYPGWGGRGFFLENLLWNQVGIQKEEGVKKEKARFRYALTDGRNIVEIYADEKEVTKTLTYEAINKNIYNPFEQLQQYKYIFSALISVDTTQESKNWELLMTNIYDRKAENDRNPFTYIKPGAHGLATNGVDTIFIKPLNIKETEAEDGKIRKLPFKLLSGYELSTSGGVVAIIDLIERNIWFYNELDPAEKLNISAIATAIFARRVHDEKW